MDILPAKRISTVMRQPLIKFVLQSGVLQQPPPRMPGRPGMRAAWRHSCGSFYVALMVTAFLLTAVSFTLPSAAQGLSEDPLNPFGPSSANGLPPYLTQAQLVLSHQQVQPGGKFYAAVDLTMADGWAYYSPAPVGPGGIDVQPAEMKIQAGPLRVGEVLWPADHPHQSGTADSINYVYQGRTIIYVPLSVPEEIADGKYDLTITPHGQACGKIDGIDQCLDFGRRPAKLSATVVVGRADVENPRWRDDPAFSAGLPAAMSADRLAATHAAPPTGTAPASTEPLAPATQHLTMLAGLGLALLAGLILNIMPCVLPVIPLKLLSIVEMAGQSRRRFISLGLAFIGGMLMFFAGLAIVNVALRLLSDQAISWGQHFKSTDFRIAMAMIVIAVAANLFGLFNVNLPRKIAALGDRKGHGHLSAAASGVLTAILSTPCSFAFLTSALAWAQVQPLYLGTIAILTIGVGMAFPYMVLLAFPSLLEHLPRPGRWMELLKQSLGFVMLLVAVWLISSETDNTYPLWVVAYGIVLAFCLWVWGAWVRYDAPLKRKLVVRGLASALAVAGGLWMLRPPQPMAVQFQSFDAAKIEQARQQGRIVLVDFTARWCLTCKAVEQMIFNDSSVADALAKHNVLAVKGDVSTSDMPANDMLYNQLKEPAIPVTVIFPPGNQPPIRLHGLYSKDDLFAALAKAQAKP